MRFTTEQAYDARTNGTPIMLTLQDVVRICKDNHADIMNPTTIAAEEFGAALGLHKEYDAADVLEWLGY